MPANDHEARTVVEDRIMRIETDSWRNRSLSPRVCLLQVRNAQTSSEETEEKRQALQDSLTWDYEDYDEDIQGARPENADPKADVQVCGIGGCTLRIFQAQNGSDIRTGECKARSFCLKERFEAVGEAETVTEGRAAHKEVLDTCDGAISPYSAGNFCPKLTCDLSAGLSVDQVPGTSGTCQREVTPELDLKFE